MSRRAAILTQADVARVDRATRTRAAEEKTFIYFIRSGEFVKIGQSKQWKTRLDQMQTGSPYTLVTLLVLVAGKSLERKLHERFRADHFRGEWFHMSPTIGKFIKEHLSECVAKSDNDDLRVPHPWMPVVL